MAEYIEREALQKRLEMHLATSPATIGKKQFQEGYYLGLSEAEIMVAQAQKADVAEVRRGRWIRLYGSKGMGQFKCSVCRSECYVETCMYEPIYAYCPNCGAKMDGGADNGERDL